MSEIGIFNEGHMGLAFVPSLEFCFPIFSSLENFLFVTLIAAYLPVARMVQKTSLGLVIMDHAPDFLKDQQLVPFGCFLSHQTPVQSA